MPKMRRLYLLRGLRICLHTDDGVEARGMSRLIRRYKFSKKLTHLLVFFGELLGIGDIEPLAAAIAAPRAFGAGALAVVLDRRVFFRWLLR